MHLPPEAIHEFRAIWRDEYGEDLPFERAEMVAARFLDAMFQIVALSDRDVVHRDGVDDLPTQMT